MKRYVCTSCDWQGEGENFVTKVLSAAHRQKTDDIQAMVKITCPRCDYLVTITFDTIKCEEV